MAALPSRPMRVRWLPCPISAGCITSTCGALLWGTVVSLSFAADYHVAPLGNDTTQLRSRAFWTLAIATSTMPHAASSS